MRRAKSERRALPLIAILCVAALVGVSISVHDVWRANRRIAVTGRGVTLRVEIADTSNLRARGLSGRRRLDSDGLLLVFDTAASHGIWMRGMLFDLDLLWLDADGEILAIREQVPLCADERCPVLTPGNDWARLVLELPAGRAHALDLRVADRLWVDFRGAPSALR